MTRLAFAPVIPLSALAVLIALILVLPIQVIKMLAGSDSRAGNNPRRKTELIQH